MLPRAFATLPHELRLLSTLQQSSRRPSGTGLACRHGTGVLSQLAARWPSGQQGRVSVSSLGRRTFSASPRRDLPPPLAILALLKSSTILAGVTTISRVLISFLPFPLLFTFIAGKRLRRYEMKDRAKVSARWGISDEAWRIHDAGEQPPKDAPADLLLELEKIRRWYDFKEPLQRKRLITSRVVRVIIGVPILMLLVAIAAGLERTPLTGRWRLILLSPTEEETLHDALSGTGWFDHVLKLLKPTPASPPPKILDPSDWRWAWVESTLRALERGAEDCYIRNQRYACDRTEEELVLPYPYLSPPPPPYPLRPRPRASSVLHHCLPLPAHASPSHSQEELDATLSGPPFSLLLIENQEANAFSYGFGDEHASGIVVNTGILDEILRPSPAATTAASAAAAPPSAPQQRSWLSAFVPSLNSARPPQPANAFVPPTPEQTLHLATVLAHEVAHLLLTHHLESLSQRQILFPSIFNLGVDLLRAVTFPFTWVFGPFFADGIAALSRTGETELSHLGLNCTNQALEVEADLVGLRILAHARFNPEDAAQFWLPDHAPTPSPDPPAASWASAWRTLRSGFGLSHPSNEVRSEAVQKELAMWRSWWETRRAKEEAP